MKTIFPNYYPSFQCTADNCKHSCCIGWEIDIDPETLLYYDTLEDPLGSRLRSSIHRGEESHFILQAGDRCPFLSEKGLCDLITELGEDALCDICADHPRFRNYHSHSLELGLGLCCEAACSLILKNETPFSLLGYDLERDDYTQEERILLSLRDSCITLMQNRSHKIQERHNALLSRFDIVLPEKNLAQWCDFYLSLERLDPDWTKLLTELKATNPEKLLDLDHDAFRLPLEQLTIYFLYRYLSAATSLEELTRYLCFSIQSTRMIFALLALCPASVDKLDFFLDLARMYSCEIEYSDKNVIALCDLF